MEMISESVNSRLNFLITEAFKGNRLLDRGMSLLNVQFRLLKTAKTLHESLAHHFLEMADFLSNFQGDMGMLTIYGETPTADYNVSNYIELFEMFLECFIKYKDAIEDVIDFCSSEKDHMTKATLMTYLLDFKPYVVTMVNILDAAKDYGTNPLDMKLFDDEIDDFLTIPIVGDN